jgi:hypothetical protein
MSGSLHLTSHEYFFLNKFKLSGLFKTNEVVLEQGFQTSIMQPAHMAYEATMLKKIKIKNIFYNFSKNKALQILLLCLVQPLKFEFETPVFKEGKS